MHKAWCSSRKVSSTSSGPATTSWVTPLSFWPTWTSTRSGSTSVRGGTAGRTLLEGGIARLDDHRTLPRQPRTPATTPGLRRWNRELHYTIYEKANSPRRLKLIAQLWLHFGPVAERATQLPERRLRRRAPPSGHRLRRRPRRCSNRVEGAPRDHRQPHPSRSRTWASTAGRTWRASSPSDVTHHRLTTRRSQHCAPPEGRGHDRWFQHAGGPQPTPLRRHNHHECRRVRQGHPVARPLTIDTADMHRGGTAIQRLTRGTNSFYFKRARPPR